MQKKKQQDQFQKYFCFFKKLYEVKASGLKLSFNILQ